MSEQASLTQGHGRTEQELASQPACWRRAGELAGDVAAALPAKGERVAVAGCGTSWFSDEHPLAELVRVHKLAVTAARARRLDPDRPRNLTRSVILAGRP